MEEPHPGITPMNSQCCISGVKQSESLMHRIRTIQGRTNLNLAEPHFACNNDERQLRIPAVVDFKKRIKHQQEILERCKRKVADQLDQLYSTRKLLKTKKGDCYETGDHTEVNRVKISQLFPKCKSKKKHKHAEASGVKKSRKIIDAAKAKAKQEEDATLEQTQAVTSLKLVQKTANTEGVEEPIKTSSKKKKRRVRIFNLNQPKEANKKEIEQETKPKHSELVSTETTEVSKESRLKNIVSSAIARLNKAKNSVQKVMKDDNTQNSEPPPNSNVQDYSTVTLDSNMQVTTKPKTKKSKRQQRPVEEVQKPLHGILKGSSISCMSNSRKTEQIAVLQKHETVSNSVMKEINSAKKIARAQSARLTRKPQRLLKTQNKSTGCLLTFQKRSLHGLGRAPDVKVEVRAEDGEAIKVPSGKDICKKVTKNTNKTLSTLNEQMSSALQESIAHLNELCLSVRNCLTDIEADELDYQKQKSKQKQMFDKPPPSECVECDDEAKKINEEEPRTYHVEELQCIPNSNQSFKITKEPSDLTTIEQVITAITLENGEIQMDMPKVVEASTNLQPEHEVSPKRKKSSSKRKKRRVKKQSSSLTKLPSMGKIDCTPSRISSSKLPIWQRQLPSIIEEIQQTVKKQATRTQYRDFLKTLKHLVGSDRCILPQKYVEKGDVHQMPPSSPLRGEKTQAKAPRQVYQKLKDVKNVIEVTGLSEVKKSKPCTQCALGRCTCGVKVENLCPADSLSARQKLQWMRTRSDMGNNSFQTYDILDEISLKDVEPIQSEYPRKDHLPSSPSLKKVEDTLLYQLVYNRNPKLLENFLQSTSFIIDALNQERKNMEKSTSERHVTTINKIQQKLRPKSASNAYRLYEKFEFDRDVPPPPERPIASDLTKEIKVVKAPKSKPYPPAKKINDSYSLQSIKSKSIKPRPQKSAQEKLRLFNKSSSAKSMSKKGKKDQIREKLRPLLQDPNFKMKKILTIMPTFIDQREQMTKTAKEAIKAKLRPYIADPDKMFMVYPLHVKYHHKRALESTAKRDVIQKLKPYIFMNFSSTQVNSEIPQNEAGLNLSNPKKMFAVYPVQVKYQYQKINGKQKTVKISRATSELELDACHEGALETMPKKDVCLETMAAKKDVAFEESRKGGLESMTKRDEGALGQRAKRGVSLESMVAKKDVVLEESDKETLESMIKREGAKSHKGAPESKLQKGALESMTKRDVIKKLKPYIFMHLSPPEVTVMPVSAKYNAKPQNPNESSYPRVGHRVSENTVPKPSTSKKNPWFPKDHGDDCYTGKRLCKKCLMQIGAEQMKHAENLTVMTHMEPNYLPSKLGDRRQYWCNNRKTTGEHMVSVVVKNTQDVKPTKTKQANIRNAKQEAANKEFYRNAANTRNKLKEVKKIVKKNDLISQDLQDIIDTIEFKIVDVLTNQKKDCSGALQNIEDEIKCVLEMVSPKPPLKSPPNGKGKGKVTSPKFEKTLSIHEDTPVRESLTTKIDNALLNLEKRQNEIDSTDNKMICIYAKGPPDNSLQIVPKKEPETIKAESEMVDSEQEDAELRNIDENIEKVISELGSLINPNNLEVKELTENLEKPVPDVNSEDVPTKDVKCLSMSFTDSQVQSTLDEFSAKELKSVDSPKEAPIVKEEVISSEKFNCENTVTNFCKQVDTVIKKITMSEESLAQKREAEDEIFTVQSGHESPVRTDEYLTPYMRAIKDYRKSANQTQSFMDFLNELSRLSQEETAVHYNYKHTMNRASIDNMPEIKEVIQRSHIRRSKLENLLVLSPPSSEKKHARKKMKNRRLQTAPSSYFKEHELETHNKSKDVQTEGEYIEEEDDDCLQPPKYTETIQTQTSEVTNRGTQHESTPFQSQSFIWSLLSEPTPSFNTRSVEANLPEIPEEVGLVETATEVDLFENTTNKDTQIPSGGNHQCFTSIENQITQVTDDLKRLCTHTIESQVSELHFKSQSHSVSIGTEPKACSLDKTCSNLSTVTSNGSYDQIKDFICIKSQPRLSESYQQMEETLCETHSKKVQADSSSSIITSLDFEDLKNKEVVSIFECKNSLSSATKVIDNFESKHEEDVMLTNFESKHEEDVMLTNFESKHEEDVMLTTICNDRVSFGINTSNVSVGDGKFYGCLDNLCPVKNETDLEIADAHKRLLGSVYGIVFTVIFLGLNLQYSC